MLRTAQLDPANSVSRTILASYYQQTGRNREALRLYEELIRIEPARVEHYMKAGIAAAMLGQLDKAEEALGALIARYPTRAIGYQELARLYLKTGAKPVEALNLIRKAVDLESSADGYYLMCCACEVNRDSQGALQAIRRALELEPDNIDYKMIYQQLAKQEK